MTASFTRARTRWREPREIRHGRSIGRAVVVTAALLGGIAATFGPVLAFEPLQPKLERTNPAEGLKRLFAIKSLVEFLKTLLKLPIVAPIL